MKEPFEMVEYIAIEHRYGIPDEATLRQSRLIAAAPAMYEALKAYLNWNEGDPGLTKIDDQARAALALAEKEESK